MAAEQGHLMTKDETTNASTLSNRPEAIKSGDYSTNSLLISEESTSNIQVENPNDIELQEFNLQEVG